MIGLHARRILTPDGEIDGYLYCDGGTITSVSKTKIGGVPVEELGDRSLIPGFIEMHAHGGGGYDFLTDSPEEVAAACRFHAKQGVTAILPTVSAAPFEKMKKAVAAIATAKEKLQTGAKIVGAHLEGPYLSPKQCGAQTPDFITPPKPEEYLPFLEEYGKYIARWTYAPENDPDGSFCRALIRYGILPSAGHTDAKYPDMETAAENGCRLVTHLYSCTSTVTRSGGFRSLGVIESSFLDDRFSVEIIADGKHLPPELIRMILKIKSPSSVVPVTDCLPITGTGVTEGMMSGTPYLVEDGVCKLRDRSAFAGSIATAGVLLNTLTAACGVPLPDAVSMMTAVPARLLGLKSGRISEGFSADFAILDPDLQVSAVFVGGKKLSY